MSPKHMLFKALVQEVFAIPHPRYEFHTPVNGWTTFGIHFGPKSCPNIVPVHVSFHGARSVLLADTLKP